MANAPSWIIFQLLEECNLRCSMCYEWGERGAYHQHKKTAKLDLNLVLKTVDECIANKPSYGKLNFEFFGGEPLLYPGIWEVIKRIRDGGCEIEFPTNGTLLKKFAKQLVDYHPTRLWISLDGPEGINDQQRGRGVFQQVIEGLEELSALKKSKGSSSPEIGITYVVTAKNAQHVEPFFLEQIDLNMLNCISIECQSYITGEQSHAYAELLRKKFAIQNTFYAQAYVRDPEVFASINIEHLTSQLARIAEVCKKQGILFHSQPKTLLAENFRNYFSAQWHKMIDRKSRCAVPWLAAEISARGIVSTCHSFYDLPVGNINEQSLLEIWRGDALARVREHLRDSLFPICTACCRYYVGVGVLPGRTAST